jgi:hypothetical protein
MYLLFLVEYQCATVNDNGDLRPFVKTDLSSRAIRIALSLGIPSLNFMQISFSLKLKCPEDILLNGINIGDSNYMFVGYSNSGISENQVSSLLLIVSFINTLIRLGFLNKLK